ncbi:DUF5105 domain-containing protein [Listeria costaricensis]|uniref:DUF5105 domain-containing protein n=1 Tax=Listeria costaricensis TaxID=2026604 RepID=UPI000C089A7F|nr:DUF5105 domain-containing protein [Listeria costaricensis]
MNKKGIMGLISALLVLLVVLTGCGGPNRVAPDQAADYVMNALIKGEDTDKLEDTFGSDYGNFESDFKESFISSFKSQLTSTTTADLDQEVNDFYDAFMAQMKKEASYTTKVTNDDKEKPEVKVNVKGLDMASVQKELTEKLTNAVTADPSLATDQDALMKKTMELYTEAIKNAKAVETGTDVTMKLEPNPSDDSQWKMSNETEFMMNVATALYMGGY